MNIEDYLEKALNKISRLNREISILKSDASESVAIIGLSGQFPGAADIDIFWENIHSGINAVTTIPEYRWQQTDYSDADKEQARYQWGGFLDTVDQFAPDFFNISRQIKIKVYLKQSP